MPGEVESIKARHLAFWELQNSEAPLVGFCVGAGIDSWSYWRDNAAMDRLWGQGRIEPHDLHPDEFVADQHKYFDLTEQLQDDVCRTAMPLPSVPWMEAILGCPVVVSDAHFASQPMLDCAADGDELEFSPRNPWVAKYCEFIEIYDEAFGPDHPVGQSILRGPSDLACALLGPQNATLALIDHPEAMSELLDRCATALSEFLVYQGERIPEFFGGQVIGQYDLWAPSRVLRMQEDFSTLYSPDLYRRFLLPLDRRIASLTDYTLMHLHSTSLFLIDAFLEIPEIRLFQVTKDPGTAKLEKMMPSLIKIQGSGRCLLLKGQFSPEELAYTKTHLQPSGLCIQPVVNSVDEAKEQLPLFRSW